MRICGWGRKSSGEEGKGKEEGKNDGKGKGKGKRKRKGKAKGKGKKGKGREGLIFFPRERIDFGEENQVGKKGREKGMERVKGEKARFFP